MTKLTPQILISCLVLLFMLAGCGKKNSDIASIGARATGVAATGSAIANGLVDVIDANGTVGLTSQTRTDGTFQIEVSGLTFPLLLKVSSGDGKTYLSAVLNSGELSQSINITPLTHALVARSLGVIDANLAFSKVKDSTLDLNTALTQETITNQEEQLNLALIPLITAVDTQNGVSGLQFRKGELQAGSGSKMDALLDVLQIDLSNTSKIVFKLKSEPNKTYDIPSNKSTPITYPDGFDASKIQTAKSDLEAIKVKMELLNSAMADPMFCDSADHLASQVGVLFKDNYLNRGETLANLKERLWSSSETCNGTPGKKLQKISYKNLNIEHVDSSQTPALYFVSFDLEVEGEIFKHAIEDVMIDDDSSDAGRDFKFIGDQFQLNVSALARTDLDQSMDPDWNISAAVAKKGILIHTSDQTCANFSGHILSVLINGQEIPLSCEENYGKAQLVMVSQKYTNGNLFSATEDSGYFLNPKADFYQFNDTDYDALAAEFPVVFKDGTTTLTISATKPASSMIGVNFNKTPQQLCSETSFESYGFDISPDKRVISSTVNYTTQTSEIATPTWGSSHIITLSGSLSSGALPINIDTGTQFLRKFYHFIAVDDFRRSYSRSLNCEKEWLNLTHVYAFDIKEKMFYSMGDPNTPAVHQNIYFFSNLLPGPLGINRWHKNKFALTNLMTSSCDVLIRVKGDNQGKFTLSNCPESPWNNKGLQWLYNPTLSHLLITDTSTGTPIQYQYTQY